MRSLKAKLNKQGGFTLIEMLIVVAIIAILIAVSIPVVNNALERARESTDAANERAFKAELLLGYTLGQYEDKDGTSQPFSTNVVYTYNAGDGALQTSALGANKGYGKSTKIAGADAVERKGQALYGVVKADDGKLYMQWGPADSALADSAITNGNLIGPAITTST